MDCPCNNLTTSAVKTSGFTIPEWLPLLVFLLVIIFILNKKFNIFEHISNFLGGVNRWIGNRMKR